MEWQEYVGYVGSFLMFSTFWMKTMIPLRVAGIVANTAMILYAAASGLYPILAMQCLMLPLNFYRLYQMRALLLRVAEVGGGHFSPDALVPFMKKESFADGDLIFEAGEDGHKLYLIRSGQVHLKELGHTLQAGEMFGEIGVLSEQNLRTASAVAKGATHLHSISREEVTQLFFQNPEFGYFLLRLITARLLENAQPGKSLDASVS